MKSIYFDLKIPAFLTTRLLGLMWNGVYYSRISPVIFGDLDEVALPGARWVRIKNRLSGICGSDLSLFFLEASPKIALAALPGLKRVFLGHEIVGTVTAVGSDVHNIKVGDRVVYKNSLPCCFNQEIEPLCRHCQQGNYAICENQSVGKLPSNLGGGWSESYIAHETMMMKVPENVSDEAAVIMEPAAVAVRAVLRRQIDPGEKILIIGAGIIGLLILHVIKQLYPQTEVTIIARYQYQRQKASALAANHIVTEGNLYQAMADITNAKRYEGMFNNQMLLGGFDKIFDCVGKGKTIHNSLRWCRAGGSVILVGVDYNPTQFDYTPLMFQEVDFISSFCHGMEYYNGQTISTFDLVLKLQHENKLNLNNFVTHRFSLAEYRRALTTVTNKSRYPVIKAVFEF